MNTWHAARWSTHEPTTVRTADPSIVTGWRVVAECDTVETARLVAVAPEMLDVLRTYIAMQDSIDPDGLFHGIEESRMRRVVAQADGAAP